MNDYVGLQICELEDTPENIKIFMFQRENSDMKELNWGKEFEQ